jgi:hypothetical protein
MKVKPTDFKLKHRFFKRIVTRVVIKLHELFTVFVHLFLSPYSKILGLLCEERNDLVAELYSEALQPQPPLHIMCEAERKSVFS